MQLLSHLNKEFAPSLLDLLALVSVWGRILNKCDAAWLGIC